MRIQHSNRPITVQMPGGTVTVQNHNKLYRHYKELAKTVSDAERMEWSAKRRAEAEVARLKGIAENNEWIRGGRLGPKDLPLKSRAYRAARRERNHREEVQE